MHAAAGNSALSSNCHLQLGWTKLDRMATALQLQQDILFVDLDIVWMADPLPALQACL